MIDHWRRIVSADDAAQAHLVGGRHQPRGMDLGG
jgi:hypothetical protein